MIVEIGTCVLVVRCRDKPISFPCKGHGSATDLQDTAPATESQLDVPWAHI